MIYTSEIMVPIAANNIDLAISGLLSLNNDKPSDSSSNEEKVEWAHFLCTYTRFVHLNTWMDCESVARVRDKFVPEFNKAVEFIADFIERKKELEFTISQINRLIRYRENISARIRNLVDNYCEGLNSAFEPGAKDPG